MPVQVAASCFWSRFLANVPEKAVNDDPVLRRKLKGEREMLEVDLVVLRIYGWNGVISLSFYSVRAHTSICMFVCVCDKLNSPPKNYEF